MEDWISQSQTIGGAVAFAVAIATTALFTPILRTLAIRLNVVDKPNARLKQHRRVVPYLGGGAVFAGVLSGVIVSYTVLDIPSMEPGIRSILIGAVVIFLLGLLDDKYQIQPHKRLAIHFLIAGFTVWSGFYFSVFNLTWLDTAVSIFWIVLVLNGLNIIDVMDGLASGAAATAIVWALAIIALAAPTEVDVVIVFLLVITGGAVCGFLPYNFRTATIYLGDAGSTLLGYLLAVAMMAVPWTGSGLYNAVVCALLLILPIFDVIFVSILRIKRGVSPMRGSKDHFAVRLRIHGLSAPRIVLLAVSVASLSGIVALLTIIVVAPWFKLVPAFAVIGATVLVGYLLSRIQTGEESRFVSSRTQIVSGMSHE